MPDEEFDKVYREIGDLIKQKERQDPVFMKVRTQLEYLYNLQEIRNMYSLANRISQSQSMNIHDFHHALSVCKYAIQYHSMLYPKVENRPSIQKAMTDEWESLFVILSGAICHDLGRSYFVQQPSMGYDRVMPQVEKGVEVNFLPEARLAALNAIQECIKYHEGKTGDARFYESGIVMLADGTDNSKNRVNNRTNEQVLRNDESPIDHYACLQVDSVGLVQAPFGVEIHLCLTGFAGIYVFQEIKRRVKISTLKDFIKIVVNLNIDPKNPETIEITSF